jgi:hypothetical protein
MATYQANITKNIEPAMANPATLQQAGASTRAAIQALGEGVNAAYKGYVEQEVANIEEGLQTQAKEFYVSRQAAQEAGMQAQQLEQQRPMAGSMFAEAMLGAQGEDAREKTTQQLKSFDDKIVRLKTASEAGMLPEVFQANVQSELKKAIAKYPGMADQIRSRFANITGIDLATQAYVSSYIKGVFNPAKPPKTTTPEELALKDIDDAAKTGLFGTREELLRVYNTDRSAYDIKMSAFQNVQKEQTNTTLIKNSISKLEGQSDLQTDTVRPGFNAVFAGSLGTAVLTTGVNDKERVFADTLKLMTQGDPQTLDPTKFQVLVSLHTNQMRTNIESARKVGYSVIDAYLAKNTNVSDAKRKELYADIDRQAEQSFRMYADDKGIGLLAMANVLKNYRDKSLTEQQMVLDLAIKQQSAMQNNPMVMAFYGMGNSRENLKRTNPDFHDFMLTNEKRIADAVRGIRSDVAAASDLADVKRVMLQAEQSGGAVPVDPVASRTNTRAAHQALGASAAELLKKTSLLPAEVNIASAAFSTNVATGANSLTLARDYKKYGEQIAKLPETDQAVIKSNVSNSVSGAVISINGVKQAIEAKYKTTLTLGVNDAGEISVVVPQQQATGLTNRPLVTGGGFNAAAAAEFMKQVKPMLNNIVYGTSMLTMKQPKEVGTEFATVINNNERYGGFYKSEAQPVTPAATTPTTQTSDLDTQVKSALQKMKEADPNLNTDFIFNAYQKATTEQKRELAKKFADNTVRMADLNTK